MFLTAAVALGFVGGLIPDELGPAGNGSTQLQRYLRLERALCAIRGIRRTGRIVQARNDERSLGELFGDLARDMGLLVRQEVGLATSELTRKVTRAARDVVDQVQGTAGQVLHQVQGVAGQVIEQVQDNGGQVIDEVQEQASRAQSFLERQLGENPLLLGAVAVAIGGVLAGAVRSTPREDELLGATRDRLMGNARQLTQETMHKIDRVVDEAQNAAQAEAREQSLIPEAGLQASAR